MNAHLPPLHVPHGIRHGRPTTCYCTSRMPVQSNLFFPDQAESGYSRILGGIGSAKPTPWTVPRCRSLSQPLPPQRISQTPTVVVWLPENEKFLVLALQANPNVLECLYTPLVETVTPLAQELLAMREVFLSRLV